MKAYLEREGFFVFIALPVAAAETTSKTTVKWTGADTIIKVDLGDKVVVPTLTAIATTTTHDETKCANGTDANGDGYVDTEIYALPALQNNRQGWLYTYAKYFPTEKTAMYYLGLTDGSTGITGGRFLAPGQAENKGTYHSQLDHKKFATVEDAFNHLVENGDVTVLRDTDGAMLKIVLEKVPYYVDKANTKVGGYVTVELFSTGSRRSEDAMIEDVIDHITKGKEFNLASGLYTVNFVSYKTNATSAVAPATTSVLIDETYNDGKFVSVSAGDIVLVTENRKGELVFEGIVEAVPTNEAYVASNDQVEWGKLRDDYEYVIATAGGADAISKPFGTQHIEMIEKDYDDVLDVKELNKTFVTTNGITSMQIVNEEDGTLATATDLYVTRNVEGNVKSVDYREIDTEINKYAFNDGSFGYIADETGKVFDSYDDAAKSVIADAVYFEYFEDPELVNAGCDKLKVTLTYKDILVKNPVNNKWMAAKPEDINLYNLEVGNLKWNNFDLSMGGTLLANAKYTFVDAGHNGYFAGNRNSAHFHLTNESNGAAYEVATAKIFVRDKSKANVLPTDEIGAPGDYNAVTRLGSAGTVTIVDITDVDGITFYTEADELANPAHKAGTVKSWGYEWIDVNGNKTKEHDGTDKYVIDGYPSRLASITFDKTGCYEVRKDAVIRLDSLTVDYFDHVTDIEAYSEVGFNALDAYTGYLYGATSVKAPEYDTFNNAHLYGMWYLETPENDTEKYVLYTGEFSGLDLKYSINTRTATTTATAADGKTTLTAGAVELDRIWYPAFDTEEELINFVAAISGLDKLTGSAKEPTSDFYEWYVTAKIDAGNPAKGQKVYQMVVPTDAKSSEKAPACTYDSTTETTVAKVTVDDTAVKTDVAGVYDITYTAADVAEDAENRTATVKVVVAPKYVRTWGANGKVKTLTSFYVSDQNAKYAFYEYDWTAKKVSVTYYNVDGSVATTAVNDLQ